MKNLNKNLTTYNEILQAYADCNGHKGERNLNFMASKSISAEELIALMPKCIPNSYNDFDSSKSIELLVEVFGDKAEYFVAREGSVCIYIKIGPGNLWLGGNIQQKLKSDEFLFDGDKQLFRVWWD